MQGKCYFCKKDSQPCILMNLSGNIISVCFVCDEEMVTNEVDYRDYSAI